MVVKLVRSLAVGTVAVLGVVGALFIAGEALSDPGGWQGVLLTAAWAAPMAALVLLALRRPALATRVLPWALAAVGALVLVGASTDLFQRSGPAGSIAMFVVVVPSGLLGLHRAAESGLLVLGGAVLQLAATLAQHSPRDQADSSGPALGGALSSSTGILVVPFLLLAALLLLTALLERHRAHHPHLRALP